MKIKNQDLFDEARERLASLDHSTFFVHADVLKGFNLALTDFSASSLLGGHVSVLADLLQADNLWMPAFNYSFPKTRVSEPDSDPSEVGALTEFFRTDVADWRIEVPMFSVVGTGEPPVFDAADPIDPWGEVSYFADLANRDGALFLYGAGLEAVTYIHHIERLLGVPYRYPKVFDGVTRHKDGTDRPVRLQHLVRPMGDDPISYDWAKLIADLTDADLLTDMSSKRTKLSVIAAAGLRQLWLGKVATDPLYFLDEASLSWVRPKLDMLGREFRIEDFEELAS